MSLNSSLLLECNFEPPLYGKIEKYQKRKLGSGDALGTPIQSYGQEVQRYLQNTVNEYHTPHLPPYLLQQHGEVRNEPQAAPIPGGA